jgi:crotonobetainyl-CoA:carnitine CoA-transferase CaiB-like acyl-CoA transferase
MQWSWEDRPVWMVTPVVSYMTGMLAALGVTAATFARRRGAPGQAVRVNGLGGAFALNTGTYVSGPGHQGALLRGGDPRGAYPNYGFYPTADGWLFVGALTQPFWVKLVTLLDRVELLADPDLPESSLAFVQPHVKARLRAELEPILRTRTTAEWVRLMRDADVPCGAVTTREQFLEDPEARAAGLIATVDDPVVGRTVQPPAPAAFSDTPAPAPRAASHPGADTEAVLAEVASWKRAPAPRGPARRACLEGIRVIDITGFIAGPVCPMLLADLGADVVKVESAEGDPFRMTAYGFVGWNRGKRSLVLDLKRPEGRDVFLDLAARADVVVDNLRAGVMNRLGIGWEALHARNPRLVHVSITGYGSSGALVDLPGFDPIFQARSGLAQAQGGTDEPVFHMIAYNDYCAGTLGALAAVAALVARERTGRGQRVDVSLFRTGFVAQAADMILHGGPPAPVLGGRDYLGPSAARRVYAASDGWLCVSANDAAAVAALGRVAGVDLRADAVAEGPEAAAIARVLAAETLERALARLAGAGVPAAPCVTFPALLDDPHVRANDAVAEIADPALGPVVLGGPLIQLDATPIVYRRLAPGLGADGPAVLAEAGFAPERIAALVAAGVVGAGT